MESREGIHSVETVVAPGAPSNYPVVSQAVANTSSAPNAGSAGTSEKKKRGRPRKSKADGTNSSPLSLVPLSVSASTVTSNYLANKASDGQSNASERKHQGRAENSGEPVSSSTGISFLPHVIMVNAGEDISMKIIAFCQQGPRSVCVISGTGLVSNATLRRSNSSNGVTLTYEGLFEILSLNGSFTATDLGGGRIGRAGGLSIQMCSSDGRLIGGALAGLLIAASPVQVTVGSFLPSDYNDLKPKKHKYELKASKLATASNHTSNLEHQNSNNHGVNQFNP